MVENLVGTLLERPENLESMTRDELVHLAEGWISYNVSQSIFFFYYFKNIQWYFGALKKKGSKLWETCD